jgi:hypothetical protein
VTFSSGASRNSTSSRARNDPYPTSDILPLKVINLPISSRLLGLKNPIRSRVCFASHGPGLPEPASATFVLSQSLRCDSAKSLLTLCPLHILCIRFEALRRSRSSNRCCLSCWACATVFWVPEAEGDQELAAKGFKFWPERLTWRGRRELPLKV